MSVYLITSITLVLLGLIYEAVNSLTKQEFNKGLPTYFYVAPSFILLFFISAFRGDFTTDYTNYANRFESIEYYSFLDIIKYDFNIETGYLIMNKVISLFTSNPVYLFALMTLIILICFYYQFNKYSVSVWLSVLMFVTAGSFYASFNISRQIVAVAIIFMGSSFLYNRKMIKYFLVVIFASFFHITSLIMIPFYFILNFRINLRNLLLFALGSAIIVYNFNSIVDFVQLFIYDNYTENSYGMTGQKITNSVIPIAFLLFSIYHVRKLDSKNTMHRIWLNATIFYAVFNILGLQIEMVERISRFFAPYALLLIPFIFSKMHNKYLRFIYMMILIFMLVLYNYVILADSVFDPYYFIWDR